MFEQSDVGMAVVDRELRLVRVNQAFGVFRGRERSEIVGRTIGEALPALASQVEEDIREVFATGEVSVGREVVLADPADPGSARWLRVNRYPICSLDGRVEAVLSMFVEVTDLRDAQLELAASLERAKENHLSELMSKRAELDALGRYRTIFEGASIGILRVETDGRMVEANPAVVQMLGFSSTTSNATLRSSRN
jgi:PAS domain S-box-containing protein